MASIKCLPLAATTLRLTATRRHNCASVQPQLQPPTSNHQPPTDPTRKSPIPILYSKSKSQFPPTRQNVVYGRPLFLYPGSCAPYLEFCLLLATYTSVPWNLKYLHLFECFWFWLWFFAGTTRKV